MDTAARGAVSVLKTGVGSLTRTAPRAVASDLSRSDQPPSGPIMRATRRQIPWDFSTSRIPEGAPGSGIRTSSNPVWVSNHSSHFKGADRKGTSLLPHWRDASWRILSHRWRLGSRSASVKRTTLRSDRIGKKERTPASVHWRRIPSNLGPLGRPWAKAKVKGEPSEGASLFEDAVYGPASQVVPEFVEKLLGGQ